MKTITREDIAEIYDALAFKKFAEAEAILHGPLLDSVAYQQIAEAEDRADVYRQRRDDVRSIDELDKAQRCRTTEQWDRDIWKGLA